MTQLGALFSGYFVFSLKLKRDRPELVQDLEALGVKRDKDNPGVFEAPIVPAFNGALYEVLTKHERDIEEFQPLNFE